jgi:hypothetical protein
VEYLKLLAAPEMLNTSWLPVVAVALVKLALLVLAQVVAEPGVIVHR